MQGPYHVMLAFWPWILDGAIRAFRSFEATLFLDIANYSHLSNKRGGGAKIAKSLNVDVGINVEGGILWKKLMHNSNKRGVEGGKNLRNQ